MENRVVEKSIKVKGREFLLKKFTPFFGVYLATQTFGSIIGQKNKLESLVKSLLNRPQEEFIKLQQDVLKYCFEMLPAGPTAVVDVNGNFAVMNMDAPLALTLFIQTLMFSMTDFFQEGAMEDLMSGIMESLGQVEALPRKK